MANIIDDIQLNESFEIVNIDKTDEIIVDMNYEDFLNKIHDQILGNFHEDHTDYLKLYFKNIIGVDVDDIETTLSNYIKADENEEELYYVINQVTYYLYKRFSFKTSFDISIPTIYKIYLVLVVNIEQTVLDLCLYNHFVANNSFIDYVNRKEIGKATYRSKKDVNLTETAVEVRETEESFKITDLLVRNCYDNSDYILEYAISCFTDVESYSTENFFSKLYSYSNNLLYKDLDIEMNENFSFSFSDENYFVDGITAISLDIDSLGVILDDLNRQFLELVIDKENELHNKTVF